MKVADPESWWHSPMRYLATLLLLLSLASACTRTSVEEQVPVLGSREFTPEKWAATTTVERGQMLGSFFEQHPPGSLTAPEVKKLLGKPTGYYEYDENLAYFIGPPTVDSKYGKERMLVFITDKRNGGIDEIELVPPLR
ncbi:hypothetical protein GCM10027317_41300 [Massilia agri]